MFKSHMHKYPSYDKNFVNKLPRDEEYENIIAINNDAQKIMSVISKKENSMGEWITNNPVITFGKEVYSKYVDFMLKNEIYDGIVDNVNKKILYNVFFDDSHHTLYGLSLYCKNKDFQTENIKRMTMKIKRGTKYDMELKYCKKLFQKDLEPTEFDFVTSDNLSLDYVKSDNILKLLPTEIMLADVNGTFLSQYSSSYIKSQIGTSTKYPREITYCTLCKIAAKPCINCSLKKSVINGINGRDKTNFNGFIVKNSSEFTKEIFELPISSKLYGIYLNRSNCYLEIEIELNDIIDMQLCSSIYSSADDLDIKRIEGMDIDRTFLAKYITKEYSIKNGHNKIFTNVSDRNMMCGLFLMTFEGEDTYNMTGSIHTNIIDDDIAQGIDAPEDIYDVETRSYKEYIKEHKEKIYNFNKVFSRLNFRYMTNLSDDTYLVDCGGNCMILFANGKQPYGHTIINDKSYIEFESSFDGKLSVTYLIFDIIKYVKIDEHNMVTMSIDTNNSVMDSFDEEIDKLNELYDNTFTNANADNVSDTVSDYGEDILPVEQNFDDVNPPEQNFDINPPEQNFDINPPEQNFEGDFFDNDINNIQSKEMLKNMIMLYKNMIYSYEEEKAVNKYTDETCIISLEPIEYGKCFYECDQCKKKMSAESFRKWMENNDTCPHCRLQYTKMPIIYKNGGYLYNKLKNIASYMTSFIA